MTAVHVFATMGTVASVRSSVVVEQDVLRLVETVFAEYDALFSRFRHDSPMSALARGETTLEDAGATVMEAFERATRWHAATEGAFTPYAVDGSVDLTGLAKALAIERSGVVLDEALPSWVLNVGGDLAWRAPDASAGQVCGVADPDDPQALLCVVPIADAWSAAATSGTSERGEHIRRTDRSARIRQATVLARDVVTADVLATAVVAGGEELLLEVGARPGVDVVAVTADGMLLFSDGVAEHVVGAARTGPSRGRHRRRAP